MMPDFEAIDGKVGRARREMRPLQADIRLFCEEKSRLIIEEINDEGVLWIYRGDTPIPPTNWSIRVGEFAYNLTSALDHLVWQLVEANGCKPGRWNQFPIQNKAGGASERKRCLKGMNCKDSEYILSIQPFADDSSGIGHRLANLKAIGNIDKHRRIIVTKIRWSGEIPDVFDRRSWSDLNGPKVKMYPHVVWQQPGPTNLVYGQPLMATGGRLRDTEFMIFPVEALFEERDIDGEKWGDDLPVSEMLHNCIVGVEMVVAHFKNAYGSPDQ